MSDLKGKLSKVEVELKGVKGQRESDENKVRLSNRTRPLLFSMVEKKLIYYINPSEMPGELSRVNVISSSRENNLLFIAIAIVT